MRYYMSALFIFSLLSACGGGGDVAVSNGSGSGIQYNYSEGIKSSESAADGAILKEGGSFPYTKVGGATYNDPIATAEQLAIAKNLEDNGLDRIATIDTGARASWKLGWTGKGVKVGIADDFRDNKKFDDHGEYVFFVINSIAPEATVSVMDMIIITENDDDVTDMTADQALQHFEANNYHIINASWGTDRFDSSNGAEYESFDSHVADLISNFDQTAENNKKALIVYAAGNSGLKCSGKKLEYCTVQGAYTNAVREAGGTMGVNSIFAGSLTDGSNNIASYSIIAGNLKDDFIVAHDDIISSGDAAGTSFSAPRVTAAAALVRHKFPNLTSPQLKQVLLQTAEDLGVAGVDETYGHGKLNILGALSPLGNIVPK